MTRAELTFVTPVHAALAEGDAPPPRTITGLGVPFGVESLPDSVTRSRYVFEGPPANLDTLVDVVQEHDDAAVIGRLAQAWEPADDGLPSVARIFHTRAGDDALELAREGVLTGFSVSTEIAKYTEAPGGARHVAAGDYTVRHLGVVRRPAFETAAGLTVAAASAAPGGTVTVTTVDPPVAALPTIAELAAQTAPVVAELLAETNRTRRHPLADFATFGDFAHAVMHAETDDAAKLLQAAFAVADQITTNNPGVVPPGWRTDVKMNLDARRPAITATGGPIGLPDAGMDASWPYFDGDLDAIIGEQILQKTDLSGPRLDIEKATEPIHTAGAVSDISYQLLLRSSPSYLDAYLRILQAAWARYTEAKFENRLFTVAVDLGVAGATADAIRGQLFQASAAVRSATGSPATAVGVSTDLWTAWGALPGLHNPAYGTSNAAGTASAATLQINVNGLGVDEWPFLPAGSVVVTNGDAARFAEYGPQVATAEDVRKLGRDVAVWGMYEEAEVYFPAGVVRFDSTVAAGDDQATTKRSR